MRKRTLARIAGLTLIGVGLWWIWADTQKPSREEQSQLEVVPAPAAEAEKEARPPTYPAQEAMETGPRLITRGGEPKARWESAAEALSQSGQETQASRLRAMGKAGQIKPRQPMAKEELRLPSGNLEDLTLSVKFLDDLEARVGKEGVLEINNGHGPAAQVLAQTIESLGIDFEAGHSSVTSDEAKTKISVMEGLATIQTKEEAADLGGILELKKTWKTREDIALIAEKLQSLEAVEFVQVVNPKQIGFPQAAKVAYDIAPTTPLYESFQQYRENFGSVAAIKLAGATGKNVRMTDIETAFMPQHEDLNQIKTQPGMTALAASTGDHGTAVLGVIGAATNIFGVSGMAPDTDLHFYGNSSTVNGAVQTWQATMLAASAASRPGDVLLYEMQIFGPNSLYGPVEYIQSAWLVTKTATDAGIHVVAAAGNGADNLDGPNWATYRARGDSGAIIIGAGSASMEKLSFSTYGSRVNVQALGEGVTTLGYGTLAKWGGDTNQSYASGFNGTSSASAVAAGVVANVLSFAKDAGRTLTASELRTLLRQTGLTNADMATIGPQINAVTAIQGLAPTFTTNSVAGQPAITHVSPWKVCPGETLVIYGHNLTNTQVLGVTNGVWNTGLFWPEGNRTEAVLAKIPPGLQPAGTTFQIQTPSGISGARTIQVTGPKVRIQGTPKPGTRFTGTLAWEGTFKHVSPVTIKIQSDSTNVRVLPLVTLPGGTNSVPFTIEISPNAGELTTTITATPLPEYNLAPQSAELKTSTASPVSAAIGTKYRSDFAGFYSIATLPQGWSVQSTPIGLSYGGAWSKNNPTTIPGLRGQGVLGFQGNSSASFIEKKLVMRNEKTNETITVGQLNFSGQTAGAGTVYPSYEFSVNGAKQSGGYDTQWGDGDDNRLVYQRIGPGETIELKWRTTWLGGSNAQIAIAMVEFLPWTIETTSAPPWFTPSTVDWSAPAAAPEVSITGTGMENTEAVTLTVPPEWQIDSVLHTAATINGAKSEAAVTAGIDGGLGCVVCISAKTNTAVGIHTGTLNIKKVDGTILASLPLEMTVWPEETTGPLREWAGRKGIPPVTSGPSADADRDGISNALEMAFEDLETGEYKAPAAVRGPNTLTIWHPHRAGITYQPMKLDLETGRKTNCDGATQTVEPDPNPAGSNDRLIHTIPTSGSEGFYQIEALMP